ncbi:MAG TPA: methyltransferase [Acidobacteriota bacterium]|nr:methyltransferase [Acidobacteriota bacterium]
MTEHYYTSKPTSSGAETVFTEHVRSSVVTIVAAPGLFSGEHIDTGSRALIESAFVPASGRLLDLGCGYGVVGISLLLSDPTVSVVFTDVNERACEYTSKNILKNSIDKSRTTVVCGDGYQNVTGLFDAIYLNPPQSAGKELCFSLITRAKEFLQPSGTLQIVARKNKGGSTLAEHMQSVFGNVSVLGKRAGFWVYCSKNE